MTSNVVYAVVRQTKEQGHSDSRTVPEGNGFTDPLVGRRALVGGAGTTGGRQVCATSEVVSPVGFGAEDFGFLYDYEQEDDDDQTHAGDPEPGQTDGRGSLQGFDRIRPSRNGLVVVEA